MALKNKIEDASNIIKDTTTTKPELPKGVDLSFGTAELNPEDLQTTELIKKLSELRGKIGRDENISEAQMGELKHIYNRRIIKKSERLFPTTSLEALQPKIPQTSGKEKRL